MGALPAIMAAYPEVQVVVHESEARFVAGARPNIALMPVHGTPNEKQSVGPVSTVDGCST